MEFRRDRTVLERHFICRVRNVLAFDARTDPTFALISKFKFPPTNARDLLGNVHENVVSALVRRRRQEAVSTLATEALDRAVMDRSLGGTL